MASFVGVCLLLSMMGAILVASNDDKDTDSSSGNSAANGESSEQPSGSDIGKPRRDGKFEFLVSSVTCGETTIGGQYLNTTAQGQFCLVSVKVTNIGDEARTFSGSNQYAFNAAGHKYANDSQAEIYHNSSNSFLEEINPGNSVDGTIIFDIPQGQSITKLELHDSSLSGGVTITIA